MTSGGKPNYTIRGHIIILCGISQKITDGSVIRSGITRTKKQPKWRALKP